MVGKLTGEDPKRRIWAFDNHFWVEESEQNEVDEATKVCSVRTLALETLTLSPHFETTKVCNVCTLRLQKFVVSALWHYKP